MNKMPFEKPTQGETSRQPDDIFRVVAESSHASREASKRFAEESQEALKHLSEQPTTLPSEDVEKIIETARAKLDSLDGHAVSASQKLKEMQAAIWKKWIKNPLFLAGLASAAVHGVVIGKGMEVPDELKQEIPKMILQPQSVDEMLKVDGQRTEREKRIDTESVSDYKKDVRDRLERGENVSFEELYLDMERLNGVPAELVEQAKQKAHERITEFAPEMSDGISESELHQFVRGMYGADANYEWGQAGVSKYFTTGKRNCIAIAKAEAIVLEGILSRMSPEERSRYEIGINKLKQHEVATLKVMDQDRRGFRTYVLEGGVQVLENTTEDVGTKTVALNDIKKAMVAEKPVTVQATTEAGKVVGESPDLIAAVDQPVDDGIRVEGPLKGSAYVMEQAKAQGIEPVKLEQGDWGTTEIEILDEKPINVHRFNWLQMYDQAFEEGQKHGINQFTMLVKQPMETSILTVEDVRAVEAQHFSTPPTTIDFGPAELLDETAQVRIAELFSPTAEDIVKLRESLHQWIGDHGTLTLHAETPAGIAATRKILELADARNREKGNIGIDTDPNIIIPSGKIHEIIDGLDYIGTIQVTSPERGQHLSVSDAKSLVTSYAINREVQLSGYVIPDDVLDVLLGSKTSGMKAFISVDAEEYFRLVARHPKLFQSGIVLINYFIDHRISDASFIKKLPKELQESARYAVAFSQAYDH